MFLGRIKCRKEKWQRCEDKPEASQQIRAGKRQRVSRGVEKGQPGRQREDPLSTRQSHFQGV